MKKILFPVFISLLLYGCNSGEAPPAAVEVNTEGYTLEPVPGSSYVRAFKMDASGNILEEGFLHNGVKEGTWVSYVAGNEFPEKLISYVGGVYNGNYIEFNERGQLNLQAVYKNNKLHGPWGKYRFGRPETTANYQDGVLHGAYREYYNRDGKIQKEINYKEGKEHGLYRFFNEEGAITVEYQYENGEQISGGIVDPPRPAGTE